MEIKYAIFEAVFSSESGVRFLSRYRIVHGEFFSSEPEAFQALAQMPQPGIYEIKKIYVIKPFKAREGAGAGEGSPPA